MRTLVLLAMLVAAVVSVGCAVGAAASPTAALRRRCLRAEVGGVAVLLVLWATAGAVWHG